MIIQAHIDKQDQLDAFLGARRRLEWAIARIVIAFVLLAALTVTVILNIYVEISSFAENAASRASAPLMKQAVGLGADAPGLVIGLAGAVVTALLWFWLYRAGRKLRPKSPPAGFVKEGLSTGKAVIDLSPDNLTIKTPLKTQKILWAAFEEIQETKTSFLFRFKNGDYEFLPKNAIPQRENKEKIFSRLAGRIEAPLSVAENHDKESVAVLYEAMPSDYDEFREWRRSGKEKKRPLLRRLSLSKPLILTGFCLSILMSAAGFYGALLQHAYPLLMMGILFAFIAAVTLLTNYHGIMQFAPHFRRDSEWPFNQTNLTTITISNSAVFRESRGVKQAFEWVAFENILEKKRAVYLVLSAYEAIAAPKRAFKDEQHYQQFVDFARARIAAAARAGKSNHKRRLQKSAVKAAPAKPKRTTPQISHQSAAGQSDDIQAAPAHIPPRPIRAFPDQRAFGKVGK